MAGGNAAGPNLSSLAWLDLDRQRLTPSAARLPQAVEGPSVAYSAERGVVLIAGGQGTLGPTNTVSYYDPKTDTLTGAAAVLPVPVAHAATGIYGQTVTLLGGLTTGAKKTSAIQRINLADGTVERLPSVLPAARAHMAAATADNGDIWLFGGESGVGAVANISRWDAAKEVIFQTPLKLPSPLKGAAAVPSSGGFLIIGGARRQGLRDAIDHFDGKQTLTRSPTRLPHPMADACAVTSGANTWLIGGRSDTRIEGRMVRLPY